MTIFFTAARYSSGWCTSSVAVFTSMAAVAVMVYTSDKRLGIEKFQVGAQTGQFPGELGFHRLREAFEIPRSSRVHQRSRHGPRLGKQEQLTAAHAKQLPGDVVRVRAQQGC